jgi:hypothetical protein
VADKRAAMVSHLQDRSDKCKTFHISGIKWLSERRPLHSYSWGLCKSLESPTPSEQILFEEHVRSSIPREKAKQVTFHWVANIKRVAEKELS